MNVCIYVCKQCININICMYVYKQNSQESVMGRLGLEI